MFCAGLIPVHDKNYVKPRLTELRKLGLIEPIGKRQSSTGVRTAVWAITKEET